VPRRSSRSRAAIQGAGLVAAAISQHPREFVAIVMATIAVVTIIVNAVFLQKGPHPAPIFATRTLLQQEAALAPRLQAAHAIPLAEPSATTNKVALIVNIQRELTRKGFYDGPADGIWGAKTDAAAREFTHAAGLKMNSDASDALLKAIVAYSAKPAAAAPPASPASNDAIAKLIAPSKRVMAVQRALADFGYGQLKPSGVFDPDTRAAIEKFERDRHLPIDGQMSDRFVRELAVMTGRLLE
jgi:Putative peptidoglycan binding domain